MAGKSWLARDWQGQSGNQTAGRDCTTLAGRVSLRALALLLFGKHAPDPQEMLRLLPVPWPPTHRTAYVAMELGRVP